MIKNLATAVLFVALCASTSAARAANYSSSLKKDLERLIRQSGGNRSAGSPGASKALAWLKAEAAKIGDWEIEEQRFTPDTDFAIKGYREDFNTKLKDVDPKTREYQIWKKATDGFIAWQESLRGRQGVNLVLRKRAPPGGVKAGEVVMVGAHYDTIIHDHQSYELKPESRAPGADDNGAAVVALLGVARALKDLKPARDLELVFFDFEEAFFLGSKAYAEALEKKGKKAWLINLEMIGWNTPALGRVKLYTRSAGHPGADQDHALAETLKMQMTKSGLTPLILKNNFDRSDNWSFWNAHHYAVTVSQDWEEHFNKVNYHSPADRPETVDWRHVERVRDAVIAAARALAK